MRRLLALVSALVWVDTMLYAALTPLLPRFAHTLGLSKTQAGVLVAGYAAGALVGGLPGGIAAGRFGPRRTVLAGLTLMGLASVGFAFAGEFWTLFGARFAQGLASGFTWAGAFAWLLAAAPRDRLGQLVGTALGAATFGSLFGPVIGAIAALAGRGVTFSAVAALAVALGVWTLRLEPVATERPAGAALVRALRTPRFLAGMAVMALAAFLFGVLSVLGPLHLAAAGWGAAGIGAVWLVGAAFEGALAPFVGRATDRRGLALPLRLSLAPALVLSLGLAVGPRPLAYAPLIVLAVSAWGPLFTFAFVLLAGGAEEAGLAQGMAFGLMNAAWASGALIGPAAAGAIAAVTGDTVPFLLCAALCAVTLVVSLRHHRAAVLVDRLPRDAA
ncbi:MAG TPA: MFS transporter [Gaiellaceae bacterium]|nr:MFS transporter [Gaiellaceae bacterium]